MVGELRPSRHLFWMEYRVFSDGMDSARAQALSSRHGHTTFAPFPALPPELRLKIWDYMMPPRIVIAACFGMANASETRVELDARPPQRLVPVVLHVNREARHFALERYELAFAWKVPYVLASMDSASRIGSSLPPSPPPWNESRLYFDFSRDMLYLFGELEPCDSFGFNSPMTYFLSMEDTKRVRKVAIAFHALRYGETGRQQIFGTLFHVADRFVAPAGGRMLVAVTPEDERTNKLLGGDGPLVRDGSDDEDGEPKQKTYGPPGQDELGDWRSGHGLMWNRPDNVIQSIWRDWYRGSLVQSKMTKLEFKLVKEQNLEKYTA